MVVSRRSKYWDGGKMFKKLNNYIKSQESLGLLLAILVFLLFFCGIWYARDPVGFKKVLNESFTNKPHIFRIYGITHVNMHEENVYSFLVEDSPNVFHNTEQFKVTDSPVFRKDALSHRGWAVITEYSNGNVAMEIHFHSLNDIGGAGWVHKRFGFPGIYDIKKGTTQIMNVE